jgi:carbon monoxide dehydrogenase subunit G
MAEEVRTSIEIEAPAAAVWDVVMDPTRLGEWVSAHKSVEWSSGDLKKGDSFRQTLRLGGVDSKIEWTVVELDRPDRAVWEGRGPARSVAHVVYELQEPRKGVTDFAYVNSFELPGGPVGRLAGRVASSSKGRKEAEKSLAALKTLIESGEVHRESDSGLLGMPRRAVSGVFARLPGRS